MPALRRTQFLLFAAVAAAAVGCSPLPRASNRADVVGHLGARTAGLAAVDRPVCQVSGLDVDHQILSEDAAVALALWNNAAFQDLLIDLDVARADIIAAGQLTNPELWTVFPIGPKQWEFALNVPLEALWLRPRRLAAAELQSRQVGERLVQDGLNVVRDVRVACADLRLAEDRLRLSEEGAALRGRIAQLAEARLRAGDASELEVLAARVDSLLAGEEGRRAADDVELARQRVGYLIGLPAANVTVEPPEARELEEPLDARVLVEEAVQTRPDLWARGLAVDAATERIRLARHDYLRFVGILPDANAEGDQGFEAGPGMLVAVPIFHQNQGPIARSQAELGRARRQYDALRDSIVLEVRQAHTRHQQAEADRRAWESEVVPVTAEAVEQAERAYQGGGVPLLLVIETSRQALAARLRHAEAVAALERAAAELERAVGRQLFARPTIEELEMETLPAERPPVQSPGAQDDEAAPPAEAIPDATLPAVARSVLSSPIGQRRDDVSLRLLSPATGSAEEDAP